MCIWYKIFLQSYKCLILLANIQNFKFIKWDGYIFFVINVSGVLQTPLAVLYISSITICTLISHSFRYNSCDVNVAVATDSGLITPIVFRADTKVGSKELFHQLLKEMHSTNSTRYQQKYHLYLSNWSQVRNGIVFIGNIQTYVCGSIILNGNHMVNTHLWKKNDNSSE